MTTAGTKQAPGGPLVGRPVLASYLCRDHEALAGFYRDLFGWTPIDAVASPIFTALDTGGVVVGFHADEAHDLLDLADRRGRTGSAVHLTIDVGTFTEVDAAESALRAAGATIIKAPFTTYYDARQIVFADPEDNVVRLSSSQAGVSDQGGRRR